MRYAEIAVNSPAYSSGGRSFSYSIPAEMELSIGQAVRVPFGSRVLEGVVVRLTDFPEYEQTRDIDSIVEEVAPVRKERLALAQWISEYYLSPLFESVSLMLPPGFERRSEAFVSSTGKSDAPGASAFSDDQQRVLDLVRENGKISLDKLDEQLGARKARAAVSELARHGLVSRSFELASARVKPKTEIYVRLARPAEESFETLTATRGKKQFILIDFLAKQTEPVSWSSVRHSLGCTRAMLDSLIRKGVVRLEEVTITRDPLAGHSSKQSQPLPLTANQQAALDAIKASLLGAPDASGSVFLLHGVTGSGKTEVYLQALAEAVKLGKQGIVLVPEISLTPQTVGRFASRFPGKVAVLHSHLSLGEQYDEWQRIDKGEFDVVIGPRSALFAPVARLGLIVIDEEHEWTYKQQEKSPRYHARDAAIRLASLTGATVVLGSATPSVETFFRAQRGDYRLLSLPERVTPVEAAPLPTVDVVDLRGELRTGNSGLFSLRLSEAISKAVASDEQVILFLNRRGASTFVQCRKCGFVMRCRRCDISLTYHSVSDTLVCHLCNYRMRAPDLCPRCRNPRIKFLGTGTQKLEEEASRAFAPARIIRWDSDSARGKNAHERILREFVDHEADVLIGTQMVTKGLDIPNVTVVGVINADSGMNLPDFRATERAFELLSQVAGRAGRGPGGGRVYFQTYSPEHFAIQAAAKHDYRLFYEKEIVYRRQLGYPPFSHLASLVYSHTNEGRCRKEAERLKAELETEGEARGLAHLGIIGPAPAFIHRLRGRYRWQIVLRGSDLSEFLGDIALPRGWTVDIDPVGLV